MESALALLRFLVAIVIGMSFFVPAFVLAVVLVPAILVPVVVMIPFMVMLDTPVRTVPVASVVAAISIVWNDPYCASIWRVRPIASVPVIMTLRRIPIALDPQKPGIFRVGAWRENGDRSGCRRRADLDSD